MGLRLSGSHLRALRHTTALAGLAGMVLFAGSAAAQDTAPPTATAPDPQADDNTAGQEVIVTARRRSETVQNVPATVSVVGEQALASTGANNLQQLQSVAPGLNLAKAPTGNEIGVTVRGLGSAPGVPSFDSSVSLFVDGVYAPRSREFAGSMFDVERIEVIRGTQAALLGKNTSLGAINLITRKPGNTFAADLRGSYEFDRGSTQVTGGMDVPLGPTLKARVSGIFTDDNGFTKNEVTGSYAPRIRDVAVRGLLVWTPSDTLDVTGLVQHDVAKNYGSPVEFVQMTDLPPLLAALAGHPGVVETKLDRHNALTTLGGEQFERLVVDKYALTANLKLGDYTLTSVTGYSRYTDKNVSDADFLPGDYLIRPVDELGKQFSQEVRLLSPTTGRFDYIVGALYIDSRLRNTTTLTANYPFGPAPGLNITGSTRTDFDQHSDTISLFGQGNYKLTDALNVTGGLRWTREKKDVDLGRTILVPGLFSAAIFPPYAPFSLDRVEKNVDYSVGVQYRIDTNAMVYASYGKGTKGGGYAQSVTLLDQAEYAKEVAKTAEIGVKLQDSGRQWLVNLAAFNTRVDGFQLVTFNGIQFLIGNTDLRSRGFELESYWYPVSGLKLFLNNTYADAKDRITGGAIPLAPKWSGSGGFTYHTALTSRLDFKLDGSIDYRTKRYYQQDPLTSPPGRAFTPVNLGVAIGSHDDRWELRLIGRNLFDETEIAFATPTPILPAGNQNAIAERGRTVALQLSARY